MKKNDLLTLKIEDITNLGFGVAKNGGAVIFVSDTVPGDEVAARIIKAASSYSVARVESYLVRSALRAERCPNSACKSCAYKNIGYEEEKRIKEDGVRADFIKAGLPEVEILPLVGSPRECEYRNKAQYPVASDGRGGYRIGFFAPKSHRVTEAADCILAPSVFSEIIAELRAFFQKYSLSVYDEESGKGLLRHIYLRRGEISGEILLTLVINGNSIPHHEELCDVILSKFPKTVGVLLNINEESTNVILGEKFITLRGRDYIIDTLAGVDLRISAPAFYQVNHDAAELLYNTAADMANLTGREHLLDLYCGAGSIGLSMADRVADVTGIEIVPEAVACARLNASLNGLDPDRARFYCGDASDARRLLATAEENGAPRPDLVVIDPPRKGTTPELIREIATRNIQRVVYISCEPETLGRDCAIFREFGYSIGEVQPVDLFPRTGHVESVVLLSRS